MKGKKANNCLLFGDAGTGKSTSIKAILNQYYDQGLRMIEVYKHQFQDLNDVIAQIKTETISSLSIWTICLLRSLKLNINISKQ